MLILTRNIGQVLKIGDDVEICVLAIQGNQVRLGINAPRDIAVHREEIYFRIQKEKNNIFNETDQLKNGVITNVNTDKGYGFIYTPGCDKNIFFHAKNVVKERFNDLSEGMDVEFFIEKGKRGLVAIDVSLNV